MNTVWILGDQPSPEHAALGLTSLKESRILMVESKARGSATSTYINRMSNYCEGCRYDPKKKPAPTPCPFNYLYWKFINSTPF